MANIFLEIGILIVLAGVGALIARLLRQPLIPLYLLVGILIGPVLKLVTNQEAIFTFSEIGIALLLFVVGLKIDLSKLKSVAKIVITGGIIKMGLLTFLGFLLARYLHFGFPASLYLGLAVAFGSTMVVLKILADRQELNSLHGRLVIGFLLVEDILAVLALIILSNLSDFSPVSLLAALGKGILLLLLVVFSSKLIFPWLFRFASKSDELLFILSMGCCFGFAMLAYVFGFSIAIGAFFAGVGLANLPYHFAIAGKAKILRDFFAVIFFVTLGMQVVLNEMRSIWIPLIAFTAFVLIVNPLITSLITGIVGYRRRTIFMTAVFLIPTSEFALIIVAEGIKRGEISNQIFALVVMLATITITLMSYLTKFDWQFYQIFKWPLWLFGKLNKRHIETAVLHHHRDHEKKIILCGVDRLGHKILHALEGMREEVLAVDLNPDIAEKLAQQKIPVLYGDINDPEILKEVDLKQTKAIISTIPDKHDNLLLLELTRHYRNLAVYVTASNASDALEFYKQGADYVIIPKFLGGEYMALMLSRLNKRFDRIKTYRKKHLKELKLLV